MINGNKIAQLTNKYILDSSKDLNKLEEYLNNLDEQYNNYKSNIRPDDIIYKWKKKNDKFWSGKIKVDT